MRKDDRRLISELLCELDRGLAADADVLEWLGVLKHPELVDSLRQIRPEDVALKGLKTLIALQQRPELFGWVSKHYPGDYDLLHLLGQRDFWPYLSCSLFDDYNGSWMELDEELTRFGTFAVLDEPVS